MIIFLYGPDSYRRQKNLLEIMNQYAAKHSSHSCEHFHFDGSVDALEELSRLWEFVSHGSLFSGIRLGRVHVSWDDVPDGFETLLKSYVQPDDIVLLLSCDTPQSDIPKAFSFLLRQPVVSQEFKALRGDQLAFFIQKEAQARDVTLPLTFIEFLKHVFGSDTWAIVNELEKAALFNRGTRGVTFDAPTIDAYGGSPANVFSFISLLPRQGLLSQKLGMLEDLFFAQEEPIKIFNILASRPQLSPSFLERLADYDVMVKSGKLGYDEVLLDLVLA